MITSHWGALLLIQVNHETRELWVDLVFHKQPQQWLRVEVGAGILPGPENLGKVGLEG